MDGIEDSVPTRPDTSGDASGREAALREILEVISQSRDDEGPVFHAILSRGGSTLRRTHGAAAPCGS